MALTYSVLRRAVQKAVFHLAKGRLSQPEMPPFGMRKTAFCKTIGNGLIRPQPDACRRWELKAKAARQWRNAGFAAFPPLNILILNPFLLYII